MRTLRLYDKARNKGVHIVAGIGSGKSRLIGRVMAYSDFIRGVPIVLYDNGHSIDNFLDRVSRLPYNQQDALWPRIRYVNMVGMGDYIVPFPLYYRLGNESDQRVAERLLEVIERIDPALQNAPIMGMNAVLDVGREVGRKLVAKGWQLTEAQSIFADKEIAKRSDAFRIKVTPLIREPVLRLMLGADQPGINWAEVVAKKQIVLLDFRDVEKEFGKYIKRFLSRFVFEYLLAFIDHRGATRANPIAVYVDELYDMAECGTPTGEHTFADDLNTLLHVKMRSHDIWFTLAHQAMHSQFPPSIQRLLLTSMKMQIVGSLEDIEDAKTIAMQLEKIDPDKIKTSRYITQKYKNEPDYIDTFYTPQEQLYQNAYPYQHLPPFTFQCVEVSSNSSYRFTIEDLEPGVFTDDDLTAEIRKALMERDGRKKAAIETAIASRVSTIAEERAVYTTNPQTQPEIKPVSIRAKPPLQ